MPSKKQQTKKRVSVTIIAGIITGIAAIIAAVIGISPKIWELGTSNLATVTPITFSRYDDPSGIFSIEYPSGYYLLTRELSNQQLRVGFCGCTEQSELNMELGKLGGFVVFTGIKKDAFIDISQEYDDTIKSVIDNTFQLPSESTEPLETILMSSEKTDNGFSLYVKVLEKMDNEKVLWDTYVFAQYKGIAFNSKKTAYGIVIFFVDHNENETDEYSSLTKHTFSSFVWSPTKINETFNQ